MPELWVMDADGSDQQHLDQLWYADGDPHWSPDSRFLLYSADGGTMFLTDADDGSQRELGPGYDPDISPDGGRIAFSMGNAPNTDQDIWTMNLADGSRTRLPSGPERDRLPAWAPDGGQIAYVSGPGDGNPATLFVMAPDGSGRRDLQVSSAYVRPEWSPDSTKLAFHRWNGGLSAVDVASGEVNVIDPGWVWGFSWSPDGTRLVFSVQTSLRVHTLGTEGSVLLGEGRSPDWSVATGRIAFVKGKDIWSVAPDGSDLQRLTEVELRNNETPLWSPDGERIAYLSTRQHPPPQVYARSVTLNLRRHLVVRGRVRSDVPSSCANAMPVRIQRKTPNGWRRVTQMRTDSTGRFKARVVDKTGRYRAFVPEMMLPSGDRCAAARSAPKRHRH